MKVFWAICEGGASLVENILIFSFYRKFYGFKNDSVCSWSFYVTFILLATIGNILISCVTVFSGTLTYICVALVIIFGLIFLKGNLFARIFFPIIEFTMVFTINVIIAALFSVILHKSMNEFFEIQDMRRLYLLILTKVLFFFITDTLLLVMKKKVMLKSVEWCCFSVIMFSTLSIGIFMIEISDHEGLFMQFRYLCALAGILIINILVFVMLFKLSRQNQEMRKLSLLKMQISQQKSAIESMELMQQKICGVNHDHLNHLLTLQQMMAEGNREDASAYLGKLVNVNPQTAVAYVHMPDAYVKAVLNVKYELCKEKKIPFSIRADDTEPTADSFDLCILLSNLLDNAIEASEKVAHPEIQLTLCRQQSYYKIVLKNSIECSVLQTNQQMATTKSQPEFHGIGTKNIREVVERYHGLMEYYEKGQWFIAQVLLPLEYPH